MKWRGWQTKPLLFALYHCDPAQWFLLGLPLYDVLSGWSALGPVWPFYSFICLLLSLAFSPLVLWLALWSVCRVREMIIGQWTLVEHSLCCSLSQHCQLFLLNEWCLMVKKYWIRLWLVLKKTLINSNLYIHLFGNTQQSRRSRDWIFRLQGWSFNKKCNYWFNNFSILLKTNDDVRLFSYYIVATIQH